MLGELQRARVSSNPFLIGRANSILGELLWALVSIIKPNPDRESV